MKLNPKDFSKRFGKKKILITSVALIVIVGGYFAVKYVSQNKRSLAISSFKALGKVTKFLPIPADEKKEIDVVNQIVNEVTQNDNKERTFLVLLQNNAELRPGGGFLGQYAIVTIKNGQVTSTFVEDANLLDQRITAKIPAPFPFAKMMSIRNWKMRDSNFSPNFPTNVEKAKYFFRLAGRGNTNFDGVIAVNSQVFDDVFTLTGPITVPGYPGTYDQYNASRQLEAQVEKAYIMDPALDTQNRKAILKKMAPMILDKLFTLGNVPKIAELFHTEMKDRNVMMNFTDATLQQAVADVHWDGSVPQNWGGDFLSEIDANMGALKTDYYMKREMSYDVDLTQPNPIVTLNVKYKHTATQGDWRTSDYHAYVRFYAPQGSTFLDSHMVSHINTADEFGKTYFGFKLDVLIGGETDATVRYQLPASFSNMSINDYKLLIQKQSGITDVPVTVHVKTKDGEFTQQQTLMNDLNFQATQQ